MGSACSADEAHDNPGSVRRCDSRTPSATGSSRHGAGPLTGAKRAGLYKGTGAPGSAGACDRGADQEAGPLSCGSFQTVRTWYTVGAVPQVPTAAYRLMGLKPLACKEPACLALRQRPISRAFTSQT